MTAVTGIWCYYYDYYYNYRKTSYFLLHSWFGLNTSAVKQSEQKEQGGVSENRKSGRPQSDHHLPSNWLSLPQSTKPTCSHNMNNMPKQHTLQTGVSSAWNTTHIKADLNNEILNPQSQPQISQTDIEVTLSDKLDLRSAYNFKNMFSVIFCQYRMWNHMVGCSE